MAVATVLTRERFARGLTYDEYKARMTRNLDRLEANERTVSIDPGDLAAFRRLLEPLDVLVLAEDWCGDVIANLPVLARLAAESGKLSLRIFPRDENDDLMTLYLNQGRYKSIPVFVFFDGEFREIGRFVERPDSVIELRARRRREVFASDPAFGAPDQPIDQLPEETRLRLQEALARMREETVPFANAEVVRELRAIVERAS